jgi:hypothetical protein
MLNPYPLGGDDEFRMDVSLRGFVKMYLLVVAFFLVLGVGLALLLHWGFVDTLAQVFFWVGIGYMAAATFAWTGFANMYRYSPTLFLGSPSYRQQIVRGQIWKEGRDDGAFVIGLCFGLALLGLAAVFIDPIFLLIDALGVALALLARHLLEARVGAKS